MTSGEKNLESVGPSSRVFAYEWQGKELRDRECVRVASKGLAEPHFCVFAQETKCCRGMPPRVFWKKSVDLLDSEGVEFFENAKESAIV